MIVLSGADLVLPDRILASGTIVIDNGVITEIRPEPTPSSSSFAFHGHTIVPGFIDVHVHGVLGTDTLDGGDAVARIAALLPRFGVTAFCPTTVACAPGELRSVLQQVRRCRERPMPHAARVLPAHLESNFINPDYCGAQPRECLRVSMPAAAGPSRPASDTFSAADVLAVIDECLPDVGIITLAPEIEGGLDLIRRFVAAGLRVSLGHSGATYDAALAAITAGARHATHLFNRMPPLHHRNPGLAGAVLQSDEVAVEVICDGVHVHPALVRMTVAAKTAARVMAISDGTAVSALPVGAEGSLGGRTITAGDRYAQLADGTMAGSLLTMEGAYRELTGGMGFSPVDAAVMCATTPARELGLVGYGVLVEGAAADLVVLDPSGQVVQTFVGGRRVYAAEETKSNRQSSIADL